jgi:hypothetical protein
LQSFTLKAKMAWLEILHQIVKVFVVSRITAKHFKTLPGVHCCDTFVTLLLHGCYTVVTL